VLRSQGRWKEAEEVEVKVMETREKVLGQEYHSTPTSMANLAYTWKSQRRDGSDRAIEVDFEDASQATL